MATRTIRREQERKFGTQMTPDGVRSRLWAPLVSSVELEADGWSLPMRQDVGGWHEIEVPGVGHGSRYVFRLPDGKVVPDPVSRRRRRRRTSAFARHDAANTSAWHQLPPHGFVERIDRGEILLGHRHASERIGQPGRAKFIQSRRERRARVPVPHLTKSIWRDKASATGWREGTLSGDRRLSRRGRCRGDRDRAARCVAG